MARGSVIPYRNKHGEVVSWNLKYLDANGKQQWETAGKVKDGITEKRAYEILEKRRVEVREDGYVAPQAFSFAKASQAWFDSERIAQAWKPGTIGQYRRSREHLESYFRGPVAAIDAERIDEYRDWALSELSPATVSRHLTVLNLILVWAKRKKKIRDKPTIRYPKVRQRKGVALPPEKVSMLARSFDDEQARTAFLTFVTAELRRFELQALRWKDVDLLAKRLRVVDSKTDTGIRSVGLGSLLAEALEQHFARTPFKGDDERVFTSETGGKYRGDEFAKALRRAFERASIEWPQGFRPCHDLRVTGATNDVRAGMDNAKLQAKLGHSNFRTTERYINLAGVVFHDEAEALEQRLFGVGIPTDPSAPKSADEVQGP